MYPSDIPARVIIKNADISSDVLCNENYRAVSILPNLSNIDEKIVFVEVF